MLRWWQPPIMLWDDIESCVSLGHREMFEKVFSIFASELPRRFIETLPQLLHVQASFKHCERSASYLGKALTCHTIDHTQLESVSTAEPLSNVSEISRRLLQREWLNKSFEAFANNTQLPRSWGSRFWQWYGGTRRLWACQPAREKAY